MVIFMGSHTTYTVNCLLGKGHSLGEERNADETFLS